jgi:ElaB/YqjD/DUF883 family membrane-anchored ribosome-binding protein
MPSQALGLSKGSEIRTPSRPAGSLGAWTKEGRMTEMTVGEAGRGANQAEPPVSEQVKEKVEEAAEQVHRAAADLKGHASGTLRSQVHKRSSQAGEQLTATSRSLRQATRGLRADGGSSVAADGIEQVAQLSERLGSYLHDSNPDRIFSDVENFVRRRPWAAVGGGLAAGLLASRLLKASSAARYATSSRGQGPPPAGAPRPAALTTANRF